MSFKFLSLNDDIQEGDLFKKMIGLSFFLHIALVLIFGVKALIFPNEPMNIDAAIRVDMVDLPDKIQNIAPPASTLPEPSKPREVKPIEAKPQPVIKPEVVILKPKKTEKSLDKIKKLAKEEERRKAIEKIESEVSEQEARDRAARQAKARAALLKGNTVSPGTALHGLNKAEFNEYIESIHGHIQQRWNLPEFMKNANLKATVAVYIDSRGMVIKRGIERSSGDTRFDAYALKAVDDSSPFPKPPDRFVDLVRVDGIILGFPE